VIYVLRCFEDEDITHVDGRIDPMSDFETIETELMLSDLESLEKRKPGLEKKLKQKDADAIQTMRLIETAITVLEDGKPARTAEIDEDDKKAWRMLQLLTSKPVLYVANVDEESAADGNAFSAKVMAHAEAEGAQAVIISAQIESEMALLDDEEQKEYLGAIGLEEPGLNRLIRSGYALLGLQTYFTVGPKEARAWTFQKGWTAPKCAGVIHGDFEKGFIRAETTAYDDYVTNNGEQGAKEAGKVRQEGKEYIVKDGDIMLFKFNV
jgi:GTP-binding protein YchF